MIKNRQASKKIKPFSKVALSTMSLKKTNTSALNTNRPKFVQKQLTEENRQPSKSTKKTFFNKTQNMNLNNRSFEKIALDSYRYSDLKSRTPSPVSGGLKHHSNQKIVSKLFSVQRGNKNEGLVEHLIDNILKQEDSFVETPSVTIKRLNQQLVELRLQNIRLEKQVSKMKQQKEKVSKQVIEGLLMDVFQMIMLSKTMENSKNDSVFNLFKQVSKSALHKLNPLVGIYGLQAKMKQNGTKLKQQIVNMTKSPKYNVSTLMKMAAQQVMPKAKVSDASTISRAKTNRQIQDSSQGSDFIIEQQTISENEQSIQHTSQQSGQETIICHHSKTNSNDFIGSPIATVLTDSFASNANDLNLKKGDKVQILKRTSSKWWIGTKDGIVGYFPAENVKLD